MTEPTTAAGKSLASWYARDIWHPGMSYMTADFAEDIAAIEREAVAAADRRADELAGLLAKALHNQVLSCKFTEEAEYTACPGPEYHAWMAAQVSKDLLERLPPAKP